MADVESEGPSRAAGGGLVDRLPVRGAFVAFLCVCTSVPALSWGQYRLVLRTWFLLSNLSVPCSRVPAPSIHGALHAQVLTDDIRVRQIVTNGITNAIKYGNAAVSGPIRVSLRVQSARVEPRVDGGASSVTIDGGTHYLSICVEDGGPGLRGLTDAVLYKDFYAPVRSVGTGSSAKGIHVGSSGVGLPVCTRCVQLRVRSWAQVINCDASS